MTEYDVDVKELINKLNRYIPLSTNIKPLLYTISELERLAKIGLATELAMKDGSKHTVFSKDIDYLLEFYNREKE